MNNNTLHKTERLKSRKLIGLLFEKGKRLYSHPLKLVYLVQEKGKDKSCIKFGVTVPKKKFPAAVDRNLIKRRMREAYRINNEELKKTINEIDQSLQVAFMVIQASDYIEEYSTIEKNMGALFKKLQTRIEKEKAST